MKILVAISSVPHTTSKINFIENNTKLDTNDMTYVINPYEEFGLTWAVKYKQQNPLTQITTICVGKNNTDSILRKSLAIGADKAIRIDTDPLDGFFVAHQIKEIVKKENYELIITGKESIDYNGGMVAGILAALLNLHCITPCIELEIKENKAIITREIDNGEEIIESELPLVIAVQKGIVEEKELIIPNMRGILKSKRQPLEIIPPFSIEKKTSIENFEKPITNKTTQFIAPDELDTLIEILDNKEKLI